MNASSFNLMLKFQGGMPLFISRDASGSRIKVYCQGEYLGVILPHTYTNSDDENDCEWLSADSEVQHRGTYSQIAYYLSVWQQTGDEIQASNELYDFIEAEFDLGI